MQRWPEGFGTMGGMSFENAYQSEKKFVAITLDGMSDATGIFKHWFEFCHEKSKSENGQTPETSSGKNKDGDKPN